MYFPSSIVDFIQNDNYELRLCCSTCPKQTHGNSNDVALFPPGAGFETFWNDITGRAHTDICAPTIDPVRNYGKRNAFVSTQVMYPSATGTRDPHQRRKLSFHPLWNARIGMARFKYDHIAASSANAKLGHTLLY